MKNLSYLDWSLLIVVTTIMVWLGVRLYDKASPQGLRDKPNVLQKVYGDLWRDTETGCQYISWGSRLHPRSGPDGKQLCKVAP